MKTHFLIPSRFPQSTPNATVILFPDNVTPTDLSPGPNLGIWTRAKMLHKLPVETLTQIFGHLATGLPDRGDVFPDYRSVRNHEDKTDEIAGYFQGRRALWALSLVHSRFHAVATPFLYQTVILHDVAAVPFFMRTVLESSFLGDSVRDLALLLTFNDTATEADMHSCFFRGLWADFGQWAFGEIARKGQPHEFDWNIRAIDHTCLSDNVALQTQLRNRKATTTKHVNEWKQTLHSWFGKRKVGARPPMYELMQGLLYCILRETPQVQRLQLQFPVQWGEDTNHFDTFPDLHYQDYEEQSDEEASTPGFCSALTELILLRDPMGSRGYELNALNAGEIPLQCFPSLHTLSVIGPATFHPFFEKSAMNIRHFRLLETSIQPRGLCEQLVDNPQNLLSLAFTQRPLDPEKQPNIRDLPTERTPTLTDALLEKGRELRELTIVLCYTTCFRHFIGTGQCLTSLPSLDRLEKLTIQMHLLFGSPRGFSGKIDLISRLPPNPVEQNIIDE